MFLLDPDMKLLSQFLGPLCLWQCFYFLSPAPLRSLSSTLLKRLLFFCKYYASPRTSEQPMNPVNNEQWTVNNNQWTMTPAENMYISMKCSVCTISYTVINIDKKIHTSANMQISDFQRVWCVRVFSAGLENAWNGIWNLPPAEDSRK